MPPVAAQGHPIGVAPFDAGSYHISGSSHVCYQDQVEVTESVDGESDPSLLSAGYPAVIDGDDTGAILCDLEEHRHGEIEVGTRRIAPPTVVIGQGVVWGAKVGGGDEDGRVSGETPLGIVSTLDLKAGPTA